MAEQGSGRSLAKRSSIWLAAGALVFCSSLVIIWWNEPSLPKSFPPAIEQLDRQIWAMGIATLLPTQYAQFHREVSDIRQQWRAEADLWWPSWTLEEFNESYQALLRSGTRLLEATEKKKVAQHNHVKNMLSQEQNQLLRLRRLNGLFDLRGKRTALSRAEGYISQGLTQLAHNNIEPARALLIQAQDVMHPIESFLIHQMSRYTDREKITEWKHWVTNALTSSRQSGSLVIVVIKAQKEFRLYQNGHLLQVFPTDLGFSGLQDKLYEGDGATPEGLFRVVQKKSRGETKFYKALMLDFPTTSHKRRLRSAKSGGLIPGNRGIGGLIEIHGQQHGQRDLTNGCVALDNSNMDKVFPHIPLQTPVVIVGALDRFNTVAQTLAPIQQQHQQRESGISSTMVPASPVSVL